MNITNKEYHGLIAKICRDIAVSNWRPDYIVGMVQGGLIPAVMIGNYFNIPVNTLSKEESNLWMAEDAFGYVSSSTMPRPAGEVTTDPATRKNILIVNDINATGKTINNLMEDWSSGCLPNDPAWENIWNNNVKFAVIYDNVSSKSKVTVDFCGEEITKSKKERIVFPYENWWA
jgi:hypoxanthine phosphoribosyltransferase